MKPKTIRTSAILSMLLFLPLTSCASEGGRDGRRQGPPPEAIKACEGKSSGDSVTFTGRRGESLKASCREIEGELAAVPEGKKHNGVKPE